MLEPVVINKKSAIIKTQAVVHTINTGGHGPGGAGNLSREAGTFDSLRPLLNLILVAAAMGSDNLTRPCLHMHCETQKRHTQCINKTLSIR